MLFEGQVVIGLNLLDQMGFVFNTDQAWSAGAEKRFEVAEVTVKLKEAVDTCEADTELFGCVFTRHFIVVDGLNDTFSEINGVRFHA